MKAQPAGGGCCWQDVERLLVTPSDIDDVVLTRIVTSRPFAVSGSALCTTALTVVLPLLAPFEGVCRRLRLAVPLALALAVSSAPANNAPATSVTAVTILINLLITLPLGWVLDDANQWEPS
jgi:hypothetical protein